MAMSKGKDEHGHALIDGLVLLIVLSAVPLALLWGCGGKIRAITDWSIRHICGKCAQCEAAPGAAPAAAPGTPQAAVAPTPAPGTK